MQGENLRSTISMWSKGDYSLNTQGAKDVIDNTTDLALGAIAAIDVEHGSGPFTIADFGAADGGTSLDLIGKLVGAVRERAPARPLCVTYTDLPRNDYCALFSTVHGERPNIESYQQRHDDVFVYAAATSFYQPIFPAGTVDFGFSATAMHWLSSLPCQISNHVHAVGAQGEELAALRERARMDWEINLACRAGELKPGGRLVTANLCIDDQGRYMGNTGGVNMFDTLNMLWWKLAEEGVISPQEYRDTTIPQFYRTVDEYCAPLNDPSSPVSRAGLRLESVQTRPVRCPYAARFEADGDAVKFAESYMPTTRTWSETVFFNSLSADRSMAERQEIVDRFYRSFTGNVLENPEGHAMDYVHVYMVMSKV